jgi:hypothetical protein
VWIWCHWAPIAVADLRSSAHPSARITAVAIQGGAVFGSTACPNALSVVGPVESTIAYAISTVAMIPAMSSTTGTAAVRYDGTSLRSNPAFHARSCCTTMLAMPPGA